MLAWLIVIAVVIPGVASTQRHEDGRVVVGFNLLGGLNDGWRLYEERDRIEYLIKVANESWKAVFVDQNLLQSVIAIGVEAEGDVPVDVSWPDDVMVRSGTVVTRFARWQPVELSPGQAVWFRVTMARQNHQRFEEGQYSVSFAVSAFETAVQRADGTPWRGITNANATWQRSVTIRRPQNLQEQVDAYLADANAALDRDDRAAVLDTMQKASALFPDNASLRLRLGLAYLGAGRYQEAITIYESLIAGVAVPNRMIAEDLARAYVGVNDTGNAVRVLRLSGVPESEISGELGRLRDGLR